MALMNVLFAGPFDMLDLGMVSSMADDMANLEALDVSDVSDASDASDASADTHSFFSLSAATCMQNWESLTIGCLCCKAQNCELIAHMLPIRASRSDYGMSAIESALRLSLSLSWRCRSLCLYIS